MKKFLVGTLAWLGAVTLLFIVGAALLAWRFLAVDDELPEVAVLQLDLREGFPESSSIDPLTLIEGGTTLTLTDAILAIDHAAASPRVAGMIARIDAGGSGFAQTQELRDAIERFRDRGKFAYAFSSSFGEFGPGTRGYYLASAFEDIHIQPLGALGLTGLQLETPLLKDALDKAGIEIEGGKRGAHKTAANMFTENGLTAEHRENLDWLATSLFDQVVEGISKGRGLEPERVVELFNGGPYTAEEALEFGLVDTLSYFDEVTDLAKQKAGEQAELVSLSRFAAAIPAAPDDAEVVALIEAVGEIRQGESVDGRGGRVMGADTIAEALEDAMQNDEVSAILMRVASGGGSAVASETIGRQVRRAIEMNKPVIVSMGDVAASGGYWIAMDSSRIVAGPGTITGSIGVFAGKPALNVLWERLGVAWGSVQRGDNADMWSINEPYDAQGEERLNSFLDQTYNAFTEGVARGRGISPEDVDEMAGGRVWTGSQAYELGLIDAVGGITTALDMVREEIGLDAEQALDIRRFPAPRPPWEQALELLESPLSALSTIMSWVYLFDTEGVVTAPPVLIR